MRAACEQWKGHNWRTSMLCTPPRASLLRSMAVHSTARAIAVPPMSTPTRMAAALARAKCGSLKPGNVLHGQHALTCNFNFFKSSEMPISPNQENSGVLHGLRLANGNAPRGTGAHATLAAVRA